MTTKKQPKKKKPTIPSVITAKRGDLVPLEIDEFDVAVDGNGRQCIRATVATKTSKVYTRAALLQRKAECENEISIIDGVLTEMDKLGIE